MTRLARIRREPEIQVIYPCPYCDGTGLVAPPTGRGRAREAGKVSCKACHGSGDGRTGRVSISELRALLDAEVADGAA